MSKAKLEKRKETPLKLSKGVTFKSVLRAIHVLEYFDALVVAQVAGVAYGTASRILAELYNEYYIDKAYHSEGKKMMRTHRRSWAVDHPFIRYETAEGEKVIWSYNENNKTSAKQVYLKSPIYRELLWRLRVLCEHGADPLQRKNVKGLFERRQQMDQIEVVEQDRHHARLLNKEPIEVAWCRILAKNYLQSLASLVDGIPFEAVTEDRKRALHDRINVQPTIDGALAKGVDVCALMAFNQDGGNAVCLLAIDVEYREYLRAVVRLGMREGCDHRTDFRVFDSWGQLLDNMLAKRALIFTQQDAIAMFSGAPRIGEGAPARVLLLEGAFCWELLGYRTSSVPLKALLGGE